MKETKNADQTPEKAMTKYDLKVQRRKEEKERELKDKGIQDSTNTRSRRELKDK